MSQNVKVYRTLEFYAQGGATKMSTIDTDDSATICYWRPETDDTGYLAIGDGTKDMDVKVFLGTSAKYVLFDVGNVLLQLEDVDLLLGDNDELRFGDASGGDVVVKWDATNLTIIPATDNTGVLEVGNDGTKSMDVKFYGATASSYLLWDNSDDRLELDGADINLQDSDILQFGDAQDVAITWDASNLTIIPATDNTGAIQIGNDGTKSMDLKLFGATASAYMEWDNSADRLNIVTVSGRAVTGEEHAFDIVNGGTLSSGDSMVGANVVTTASGTAGSWVSAGYFKTVQASKVVNGYLCAAEFELQSTAANASDNSVIVLNSTSNHSGSPPACTPYITLREYGTTPANVLIRIFGDTGQGDTSTFSATALITSAQNNYETGCNAAVRIMSGSTPVWLLASTTAPTA